MSEAEKLYDPLIGQQVGNGQCGALTSDYMLYLTEGKYQWAGEEGDGELPPHTDAMSAWNVYTQTDWNTIGFEYINKPTKEQLRGSDTFYIAPRPDLPTGHTGLVASIINGNITTFEQNVLDAKYVQKLPGANSWDWYGGFDGVVRKKDAPKPSENQTTTNNNNGQNDNYSQEEEEMIKFEVVEGGAKGTKGYLYQGRFIVGGSASSYNTIYQKLADMEKRGLIKPIKEPISTGEYNLICSKFPSHKNSK